MKSTLIKPPLLIIADELSADLLESIYIGIKAQVFIKVYHWKTKILSIIIRRDRCASTSSE